MLISLESDLYEKLQKLALYNEDLDHIESSYRGIRLYLYGRCANSSMSRISALCRNTVITISTKVVTKISAPKRMFGKKDGIYYIAFFAENKVKESYNKVGSFYQVISLANDFI